MNTPTLMLFAAGFGTRMGPLTRDVPKPMLPLGGAPMIDRAVAMARAAGIGRIVANTHHLHDRIAPHLRGLGVEVRHESGRILDTGGGLKAARPLLSSPTLTCNPDVVFIGPNPLSELMSQWQAGLSGLLLLVPTPRTARETGDFDLAGGQIRRGTNYVYTGAQLIGTEGLDRIEDEVFSLNAYWDRLIAEGGLHGCVYSGQWLDIGTPDGLAAAETALARTDV